MVDNAPPLPLVSIIVPVWNDAPRLIRCLRSLDKQDYPPDRFQIIVVDNGSLDESRDVAASFSRVTVLQEANPGSYSARNRGLRSAHGDYVAFIDSDCEASPHWLRAAVSAADGIANLGIIAGRVDLVTFQDSASAAALYEFVFAFNQRENAAAGLCVTANWLSPRAVLERFHGFDATLKSGGDTDLATRIASAGYRIVYADMAVVHHPARTRLTELCGKRRRLMGGRWNALDGHQRRLSRLFLAVTKRIRRRNRARHRGSESQSSSKDPTCRSYFCALGDCIS